MMEKVLYDNVIGPVVNFLTSHITKHLGYATCSTKHVNNMRNKMKDLNNKNTDVKNHMDRNIINNKEIPTGVTGWLNDVEDVDKNVQSVSTDGIGCFNLKMRYRAGKKACEDTARIDKLIEEFNTNYSPVNWTDAHIPTRIVDSEPAPFTDSTPSLSSSHGDDFKSRQKTFNDALKLLQQENNKTQVIALCGMGGVGKTTMMKQLKAHEDVKKLYQFVMVAVGEKPNLPFVQNDIALCLGGERLKEETIAARVDSLCRKFKATLEKEQDKKLLVMLDDVWKDFKLKDIGLPSPLPDRIKLLLTSRSSDVCKQIAFDAGLVLEEVSVNRLDEVEAQTLFSRTTGVSEKDDHARYQIGSDIAKKCGGLPLAINLIGRTLKSKKTFVWRSTLKRLKNNQFDDELQAIVKISYEHIKDEEKEIFLHCSLFPEDSNIPIEDLTRYAWGLELLKGVSTLGEARDRTNECVEHLIDANLLMSGDDLGCVKVHDIVLSFMLGEVSKTWTIKHDNASKWSRDEMNKSCQRLSLTCTGMSEIPIELKYQNLSLLQLMHGDLSLKFPKDFYENVENLKVIAYYGLHYPLLPRSLQCSTNLKSLCLFGCKLMFDCSFVGDLVNLEVLSFALCGIRKLPSTIGNLVNLKLLDLRGCVDLHIEDGVFKNLQNLEELYIRDYSEEATRFTDANFEELKMLSLCALEVEFVEEIAQLKNVCFKKLHNFNISVGCKLEDEAKYNAIYSFKNTLKLVTDCNDLLDSKINELFQKTEKLHLQVEDMTSVEDIVSVYPYDQHLFCKLRDLKVSNCANLKYLFPVSVASGLRILERLKISSCDVLETLVQNNGSEINNVGDMVKFGKLKFLSLKNLPRLESLFLVDHVVELPQLVELEVNGLPNFTSIYHDKNSIPALLNSHVRISELKKLKIKSMENLKQIWDVLPTDQMQLLNPLERLIVDSCGSIEMIFNIVDVECIGQVELVSNSKLKSIEMFESKKVREVGRIKGGENIRFEKLKILSLKKLPKLVCLFLTHNVVELPQLVELEVDGLPNFTSIYPDNNNNSASQQPFFNSQVKVSELKKLEIKYMENLRRIWSVSNQSSEEDANNISMLKEIRVVGCDSLVNLFPTNPRRLLGHLERLDVSSCGSVKEIFDIDLECVSEVEQASKIRLRNIYVSDLKRLRVVWRIKGGENNSSSSLIPGFEVVENINIYECKRFINLFTPTNTSTITKFDMQALTNIKIYCSPRRQTREVRKERDYDISAAVAFPSNLMHSFRNLQKLSMDGYNVEVVFDTESSQELLTTTSNQQPLLPNLRVLYLREIKNMSHVWKCGNWNKSSFQNLTTIDMWNCNTIKYLFSPLMAKLLSNLKSIKIYFCDHMEEVVSNRDDKDEEITTSTTTLLPNLHSLTFESLKKLKRIGGGGAMSTTGINHDQFKSSHATVVPWSLCQYSREIVIVQCKSLMEVFETQEINNSSSGGITSTTTNERIGGTDNTSLTIPRLDRINVPQLSKLKSLVIAYCNRLQHVFTFSTLESLKLLEELMINGCNAMKVIVKKENEEQRKVVNFLRLRSLELHNLPNLEGFFLGMNDFQWPSVEKVMIDNCPKMMVFTFGQLIAPKLEYMHTGIGKHTLECDLNSYVTGAHQTNFPTSESTSLQRLPAWSFQNVIEIEVTYNDTVNCIIPSNELQQLQKLESILVKECRCVEEVFEVEEMEGKSSSEESPNVVQIPNLTQLNLIHLRSLKHIWRSSHHQRTVLDFPSLTRLYIQSCDSLEHVFTSSMVGSLLQLQDLHISFCFNLEVIVKEEESECDSKVKEIVTFPCLKSLTLGFLGRLKGLWLGKDDFPFPSLHTLEIEECPELEVFTKGRK